jgi:hypothetical protein
MSKEAWGKRGKSLLVGSRLWVLFGVLLVVLTISAVVGTQPVRASLDCTMPSNTCYNLQHGYATGACRSHGGLANFLCPLDPVETDDFYFDCADGFNEVLDCHYPFGPS